MHAATAVLLPCSNPGYTTLCVGRDPAAGPQINMLRGAPAAAGCPAGLATVGGVRRGPPLPMPNATVCLATADTVARWLFSSGAPLDRRAPTYQSRPCTI